MEITSSTPPQSDRTRARFSLKVFAAWLTLCVIWSSTWLAIKVGLADLPPISFVALRFIIAAGILSLICAGRFQFFPRRLADYSFLAFTGILTFAINYGLLFWGEQHVSSGLAAILQATIPTFGLVFAHFRLPSEPMKWERVLGAIFALGGVAIICAKLLDFQGIMAFWGGVAIVVGEPAHHFSDHATVGGCIRMVRRRRDTFSLGIAGCGFRLARRNANRLEKQPKRSASDSQYRSCVKRHLVTRHSLRIAFFYCTL
jgi:drug/metabolite transporter (DMT)-like permease